MNAPGTQGVREQSYIIGLGGGLDLITQGPRDLQGLAWILSALGSF